MRTAPLSTDDTPIPAARQRVRRNERRSLVRRFDHACEAAEAAIERMRRVVSELVLLDEAER